MAIQQKLHTKLVQKLILTPSLQQAIKLLPMSTLELADLLNQEMVENPLLEEVPTEDQTQEQAATPEAEKKPEKEKDESWDDAELGDCGADIAPGTPVHEAEVVDGVFAVLELLTSGE